MKKHPGFDKANFLIRCARNIILKVPREQDDLISDYRDEINNTIVHYLKTTTSENLEMIYSNEFEFKMSFCEIERIFRMRFEYLH